MSIEHLPDGTPYLSADSYLSDTPKYTQEMARHVGTLGGGNSDSLEIARAANPVGTIIPYAGEWGTNYSNLADPDLGAPFHLPCTGGVYESADFPLLARLLRWHYFAQLPKVPQEGDIVGGGWLGAEYIMTDVDGNTILPKGIYRYQTSPLGWKLIVADGFVVPDFRGRSPMGVGGGDGDGSATGDQAITLGMRHGHQRPPLHYHSIAMGDYVPSDPNSHYVTVRGDAARGGAVYTYGPHSAIGNSYASPLTENLMPITGVNFLIFTGQVVPQDGHAPLRSKLRDGSAYRLHPVTTEHMIHERLADPNISDEEREMLEAELNRDQT